MPNAAHYGANHFRRTHIVLCTIIDHRSIGQHGFFNRKPHLSGLRVAGHWDPSEAFLRSWHMTVAPELKPCLDLVDDRNFRAYPCNNPWKTTEIPRMWAKLAYQRGASDLPTDREAINARSFARPWLDTAWSYKAFNLKQSRMLPAGRYAAVMFKTPEPNGEHYHAEVPIFPAKAGDAYLATRIMPGGAWQKQSTTTSFGVFGHTAP